MPSRASKPKRPRDVNQLAARIVRLSTGQETEAPDTRNPAAVALGRLGASKGGEARAKKLTAQQRSAIAKRAAKKRWTKA